MAYELAYYVPNFICSFILAAMFLILAAMLLRAFHTQTKTQTDLLPLKIQFVIGIIVLSNASFVWFHFLADIYAFTQVEDKKGFDVLSGPYLATRTAGLFAAFIAMLTMVYLFILRAALLTDYAFAVKSLRWLQIAFLALLLFFIAAVIIAVVDAILYQTSMDSPLFVLRSILVLISIATYLGLLCILVILFLNSSKQTIEHGFKQYSAMIEVDTRDIYLAVKYSFLSVFPLASTLCLVLTKLIFEWAGIEGNERAGDWFLRIDAFVNSLCVFLFLNANDRYYQRYCSKCHCLQEKCAVWQFFQTIQADISEQQKVGFQEILVMNDDNDNTRTDIQLRADIDSPTAELGSNLDFPAEFTQPITAP